MTSDSRESSPLPPRASRLRRAHALRRGRRPRLSAASSVTLDNGLQQLTCRAPAARATPKQTLNRPGPSAAITPPARIARTAGWTQLARRTHSIAEESANSERRADDAERDLLEGKKAQFSCKDCVGEDFEA